jgi:hypothetical protein
VDAPAPPADRRRAEIEQWFLRRGLPHFIDGYDARRDVLTRSIPALIVAYLLGGLNALELRVWSPVRNLLLAGVIVALLLGTWAVANRVRRRPAWERPRRVGGAELAVFVLGPAVPALLFGRQWGDALQAVVTGLALLGGIYLATSYAVLPVLRWASGRLAGLLAALGGLVIRALPLLLLIVTFSFLGAEVWEMAGTLPFPLYPVVLGLFVLTGAAFLAARLPSDIGTVGRFDSWDEVRSLLSGTPAETCELPADGAPPDASLNPRQWVNVALVSMFTQGVQIMLVALTVGVFFTVFGIVALSEETVRNWTQLEAADVWLRLGVGGRDLVLTTQLVQVAGFLATFTGFYFSVVIVNDETYRREFRDDVVTELRESLAVHCAYRHELTGAPQPPR